MFLKSKKSLLIAFFLIISSFLSVGFSDNFFEISKNLDIFAALFKEVNENYVDQPDPASLMKSGIDAMLKSLDPYTVYYLESAIEDVRFINTGQYGGLGTVLQKRNGIYYINKIMENSPAQKSGLRPGDVLISVEGKLLKDISLIDINSLIRGGVGSPLKILIKSSETGSETEKIIVRDNIKIPNISFVGTPAPYIGYVKLSGFTQNAGKELRDAVMDLKKNKHIKGFILDLRGNPGGLLNEAVNVSNVFINKDQLIVSTKGRLPDNNRSYITQNSAADADLPIVVLTNAQSASASEIVAGSIQDLDRGVILGQRTFGKGLVQNTRKLAFNTQMKLTVAKYYIPSGRCIQALDYLHRNSDGSVGKIPDSLAQTYHTRKGRTVKEGGGINPDVLTKQQSHSPISQSLLNKGFIFDYATLYRNKHPAISDLESFSFTDSDFNDFVNYLQGKDYDYTTKSEKALELYKQAALKENYFESIRKEYENMKSALGHDKKLDLQKSKDEIKGLLESETASRYYFERGRVILSLKRDSDLKKAVALLNNPAKYKSLLTKN